MRKAGIMRVNRIGEVSFDFYFKLVKFPNCKSGYQSPINLVTGGLSLTRNTLKFEYDIAPGGWTATIDKGFLFYIFYIFLDNY
jgi:hypothetical protein